MSWQGKQSINFYTDEFRPPELPAEIRLLFRYGAAGLGSALLLTLLLVLSDVWFARQLTQTRQAVADMNARLEQEQRRMPPLTLDPALESQRVQAEANLHNSQRVLNYLSQQNIEERISFTPLLRDLEKVSVDGVWLTGVSVFHGGQHLQLRGHTSQASRLSPYIARLTSQPAYIRRGFRRIHVTSPGENASSRHQRAMTFVLDTRAAADEEARTTAEGGL